MTLERRVPSEARQDFAEETSHDRERSRLRIEQQTQSQVDSTRKTGKNADVYDGMPISTTFDGNDTMSRSRSQLSYAHARDRSESSNLPQLDTNRSQVAPAHPHPPHDETIQPPAKANHFECDRCEKTFPIKSKLKRHLLDHDKPETCPICSHACPTPSILRDHIMRKHGSTKMYYCKKEKCRSNKREGGKNVKYFSREADLRRHLKNIHGVMQDVDRFIEEVDTPLERTKSSATTLQAPSRDGSNSPLVGAVDSLQHSGVVFPSILTAGRPSGVSDITTEVSNDTSLYQAPPDFPDVETLTDWLQGELIEWPEGSNSHFLPIDAIRELKDTKLVQRVVREMLPDMDREARAHYVDSICSSTTRIFAILLCIFSGPGNETPRRAIFKLIDERISDEDLPFARFYIEDKGRSSNLRKHANRRYTLARKEYNSCTLRDHRACVIKTLSKWSRMEIQTLCRGQWITLSPVFESRPGEVLHYDIEDPVILPFTEDNERDMAALKQGGYSEVWPIRVHPAHQNILYSSHPLGPLLAVKRLYSLELEDFKKERDMLTSLTLKGHPHLVKLLITYTYKNRFHLLSPFANANLREYWNSPKPPENKATYLWVLQQMAGLASGLNVIHNFRTLYPLGSDHADPLVSATRPSLDFRMRVDPEEERFGRHGDLKPENILWFNYLEGFGEAGVLQIADLGLGRFHRLESRSRQDPRFITGSPTYIPPELALDKYVSRAYDVWSLGCIFLEFITWLLEGSVGLDNFGQARIAQAPDGISDDLFYMIINSGSGKRGEVRQGVTTWMERLRLDHPYSAMVLEILDVVQFQMLVVNSEDRIRSDGLALCFQNMVKKGKTDPVYLLGNVLHYPDVPDADLGTPTQGDTLPSPQISTNEPTIRSKDDPARLRSQTSPTVIPIRSKENPARIARRH